MRRSQKVANRVCGDLFVALGAGLSDAPDLLQHQLFRQKRMGPIHAAQSLE